MSALTQTPFQLANDAKNARLTLFKAIRATRSGSKKVSVSVGDLNLALDVLSSMDTVLAALAAETSRADAAEAELGLTKIHAEYAARHLESCESALEQRNQLLDEARASLQEAEARADKAEGLLMKIGEGVRRIWRALLYVGPDYSTANLAEKVRFDLESAFKSAGDKLFAEAAPLVSKAEEGGQGNG